MSGPFLCQIFLFVGNRLLLLPGNTTLAFVIEGGKVGGVVIVSSPPDAADRAKKGGWVVLEGRRDCN